MLPRKSGETAGETSPSFARKDTKVTKAKSVHVQVATCMGLWFFCSGCTLFGNKHILSTLRADPNLLALSQMLTTATLGAAKMYGPEVLGVGRAQQSPLSTQPLRSFLLDMALVGFMRFVTVVLGLVSLKHGAVSFTETVKSSAPFFTVLFASLLLKEYTSSPVKISLVPVVLGLALCSGTELSFTPVGFTAAVLNNCIDCVQNVFSKRLLSSHYTYVNLQFYTSAAALVVQLPVMLYLALPRWLEGGQLINGRLAFHLILNGVAFHAQSVSAYALMGLVSPITVSVANTFKRALLIWLSVLVFGNRVSAGSAGGTALCILGVLAYTHARRHYPYVPPQAARQKQRTPKEGLLGPHAPEGRGVQEQGDGRGAYAPVPAQPPPGESSGTASCGKGPGSGGAARHGARGGPGGRGDDARRSAPVVVGRAVSAGRLPV